MDEGLGLKSTYGLNISGWTYADGRRTTFIIDEKEFYGAPSLASELESLITVGAFENLKSKIESLQSEDDNLFTKDWYD